MLNLSAMYWRPILTQNRPEITCYFSFINTVFVSPKSNFGISVIIEFRYFDSPNRQKQVVVTCASYSANIYCHVIWLFLEKQYLIKEQCNPSDSTLSLSDATWTFYLSWCSLIIEQCQTNFRWINLRQAEGD